MSIGLWRNFMDKLLIYLKEVRKPFYEFYIKNKDLIETGKCRNHPGKQNKRGGLKLHILQVIGKALELNQVCDRQEIIECCLVHDLKGYSQLPLTKAQKLAIETTKGRIKFREWRFSGYHKFVVLILIADMWSAYINEKDL